MADRTTPGRKGFNGLEADTGINPRALCDQNWRGDPFPEITMPGLICERCGAPVLLTREPRPGVPFKRFCSSRCQLAAQKRRWKQRRAAAARAEALETAR